MCVCVCVCVVVVVAFVVCLFVCSFVCLLVFESRITNKLLKKRLALYHHRQFFTFGHKLTSMQSTVHLGIWLLSFPF